MNRIAPVILALSIACSEGPPSKQAGIIERPKVIAAAPSPTPAAATRIDAKWTSIPADFTASDPRAVIHRLQVPRTDEFETTVAYSARVATQGDTSTLAFTLPDTVGFYDADAGAFVISIPPALISRQPGGASSHYGASLRWIEQTGGSYEAANAFGATAAVKRKRLDVIALGLPGSIENDFAKLTVAPDSARVISPHLRFLLVVKPRQLRSGEFVTDSTFREKPTVQAPRDLVRHTQTLWVSRIALWIYDNRSGRILAKRPVS